MSKPPPQVLEHSPTFWFTVLTWALCDGNRTRAAEARHQLRSLGFDVRLASELPDPKAARLFRSSRAADQEGEVSL